MEAATPEMGGSPEGREPRAEAHELQQVQGPSPREHQEPGDNSEHVPMVTVAPVIVKTIALVCEGSPRAGQAGSKLSCMLLCYF